MVDDASVNISAWIGGAMGDSLSRDLDLGLLGGTGPPQPGGVVDQADEVDGPTLVAAAAAALAEIGEAGGSADTVLMSPTAYAGELAATDTTGRLLHPDGLDDLIGLDIVQSPGLAAPLVYDSARVFFVLGSESTATLHDYPERDGYQLLIKARCNAAVPVPAKSIRKLSVTATPDPGRAAARSRG